MGWLALFVLVGVGLYASPVFGQCIGCPCWKAATTFALVGGSTITSTGPTNITGDLGLYPGTSVTGFPIGTVNGDQHVADGVALASQTNITSVASLFTSCACTRSPTADLSGLTLDPGTNCFGSSAMVANSQTLTLDAHGDASATFVFKIGSTLTVGTGAKIQLLNGACACNVFFVVGSSATLGTTSSSVGVIIAQASITANTGASVLGALYAQTGAVTLDSNSITACRCINATTAAPSSVPSQVPIAAPSTVPSAQPHVAPTTGPSQAPIAAPSRAPNAAPTIGPSQAPILAPTDASLGVPSGSPAALPTATPHAAPSVSPIATPTFGTPTPAPVNAPTAQVSEAPSSGPTEAPSEAPAESGSPSEVPTGVPTPCHGECNPNAPPHHCPDDHHGHDHKGENHAHTKSCCEADCTFSPWSKICREADPRLPCDIPEYCTGNSAKCPCDKGCTFIAENLYLHEGHHHGH